MKKTLLFSFLLAMLIDLIHFGWGRTLVANESTLAPAGNNVAVAASAPQPATKASPLAVTPAPADPAVAVAARLQAAGLSSTYAGLYLAASARTGTPWQLIAAVHSVESHQAGNTSRTSYAGAVGPFQFLPSTWAAYAMDGSGDGRADITNVYDGAVTAGHYLAATGAKDGHFSTAVYRYNHSNAYVDKVMGIAYRLGL